MFHQAKAGSVQGEISPASKLARYAGLLPYVVCDRIGEILNWTDFPTVLDHTIYAARQSQPTNPGREVAPPMRHY